MFVVNYFYLIYQLSVIHLVLVEDVSMLVVRILFGKNVIAALYWTETNSVCVEIGLN